MSIRRQLDAAAQQNRDVRDARAAARQKEQDTVAGRILGRDRATGKYRVEVGGTERLLRPVTDGALPIGSTQLVDLGAGTVDGIERPPVEKRKPKPELFAVSSQPSVLGFFVANSFSNQIPGGSGVFVGLGSYVRTRIKTGIWKKDGSLQVFENFDQISVATLTLARLNLNTSGFAGSTGADTNAGLFMTFALGCPEALTPVLTKNVRITALNSNPSDERLIFEADYYVNGQKFASNFDIVSSYPVSAPFLYGVVGLNKKDITFIDKTQTPYVRTYTQTVGEILQANGPLIPNLGEAYNFDLAWGKQLSLDGFPTYPLRNNRKEVFTSYVIDTFKTEAPEFYREGGVMFSSNVAVLSINGDFGSNFYAYPVDTQFPNRQQALGPKVDIPNEVDREGRFLGSETFSFAGGFKKDFEPVEPYDAKDWKSFAQADQIALKLAIATNQSLKQYTYDPTRKRIATVVEDDIVKDSDYGFITNDPVLAAQSFKLEIQELNANPDDNLVPNFSPFDPIAGKKKVNAKFGYLDMPDLAGSITYYCGSLAS